LKNKTQAEDNAPKMQTCFIKALSKTACKYLYRVEMPQNIQRFMINFSHF